MSTAPARPSGLPVAVLLRSFRVIPQAMGLLREAVPKNEGFPHVLASGHRQQKRRPARYY